MDVTSISLSAIKPCCFCDCLERYEKSADVWTLLPVASNELNWDKFEREVFVARFPVITKMHGCGVWHCVVLYIDIYVSEKYAASSLRLTNLCCSLRCFVTERRISFSSVCWPTEGRLVVRPCVLQQDFLSTYLDLLCDQHNCKVTACCDQDST